ncbi:hypothetical protein AACH10_01320 [Ideonella sp. DXS22W]|uniref:Uncharacterized protein n=1 Tax=Pseudaquabacterium inlustre TaxID=2984192 RepID=A0ABU9CE72_9BURK
MHPWILGVGLTLAGLAGSAGAAQPAATPGPCPAAQAPVRERFTAADCTDCWAAPDAADTTGAADAAGKAGPPGRTGRTRPATWTLDWLLPRGDDAPMSAAALPAGTERQQRAAAALAQPSGAWPRGARLQVESGPAWQGYFGLRLSLRTPRGLPPGATAWLALVEKLPAGSEGSAAPRWLVRNVAGPLPLDTLQPGRAFSHLTALRWPDGAQPERLRARGWIESADGRVLAMGADRCP